MTVSPAAIELVLDRSGSMATPIPGGTRMTALQSAVSMFSDLVIPDTGFSMGSVQFDDQFAVLTALQNFDATQQNTIKTDANTLTPRGFTSIGGGLKLGQSSMSASSQARKVAIVFTDGFENTPPTIASIEPGVLTAGTEVYAVGLGDPAFLSVAALSELAASSNGKFFQTTDPLVLRKQFVEILADAFRQNMAADPLLTLQQGVPVTVPVNITNCEGRISFVLLWEDLWVNAGQTPQNLIVQSINGVNVSEIGPAILLPDGRVFAVGGTGHTAIFDPSQPVASAWSNGPDTFRRTQAIRLLRPACSR
ncbi:MAG TPA: vWA domain-containing protein [Candidatus Angelobacter sp.]